MIKNQNILVCITQQKTCERLIRKAEELKATVNGDLFVLHVAKNEANFLDNEVEGEALEYLFGISKSVGASLSVLKSENIISTIVNFSIDNNIGYIILGDSPSYNKENHFFNDLKKMLKHVEFCVIPQVET